MRSEERDLPGLTAIQVRKVWRHIKGAAGYSCVCRSGLQHTDTLLREDMVTATVVVVVVVMTMDPDLDLDIDTNAGTGASVATSMLNATRRGRTVTGPPAAPAAAVTLKGLVADMDMVAVVGTSMDTDMDTNMDMVAVVGTATDMDTNAGTDTSAATSIRTATRRGRTVTGPPAAPAAVTLTKGRFLGFLSTPSSSSCSSDSD
ncbi:hypothetical protein PAMP_004139 [Pampus punctatissimus]